MKPRVPMRNALDDLALFGSVLPGPSWLECKVARGTGRPILDHPRDGFDDPANAAAGALVLAAQNKGGAAYLRRNSRQIAQPRPRALCRRYADAFSMTPRVHFDAAGRLHALNVPISKATVNTYFGRELLRGDDSGPAADEQHSVWRLPLPWRSPCCKHVYWRRF